MVIDRFAIDKSFGLSQVNTIIIGTTTLHLNKQKYPFDR